MQKNSSHPPTLGGVTLEKWTENGPLLKAASPTVLDRAPDSHKPSVKNEAYYPTTLDSSSNEAH